MTRTSETRTTTSENKKSKPAKSPKRSRSISFSRPIIKPKTKESINTNEPQSILKSPRLTGRTKHRSSRQREEKSTVEKKIVKVEPPSTSDIEQTQQKKSTRVTATPFEKLLFRMIKRLEPHKRITQKQILEWWKASNIPLLEQYKEELPDLLKVCALDPDYRFSIDIHELRKLYQQKSEEKIRQYAFMVERYFRTMLGMKTVL